MAYRKRSQAGYAARLRLHVKIHVKNPKGFRVGGEHGTFPATLVIPFEVEELGNNHILEEASKVLQCEPTLDAIKKALINACFFHHPFPAVTTQWAWMPEATGVLGFPSVSVVLGFHGSWTTLNQAVWSILWLFGALPTMIIGILKVSKTKF
jgi:hypothetical protein